MRRERENYQDQADLERLYEERRGLLGALASNLERSVVEQLQGLKHVDRISFRVKDTSSYVKKALSHKPPYRVPLVEVEDQIGGRVIVFFLSDVEVVRERIHEVFRPVEGEYRRPEQHNVFDYESWQGVFNIPPQARPDGWKDGIDLPETFELQIRTLFQHAYAEPQHEVAYKPAEELSNNERRELAWVAASAWGADQALDRVQRQLAAAEDAADQN